MVTAEEARGIQRVMFWVSYQDVVTIVTLLATHHHHILIAIRGLDEQDFRHHVDIIVAVRWDSLVL